MADHVVLAVWPHTSDVPNFDPDEMTMISVRQIDGRWQVGVSQNPSELQVEVYEVAVPPTREPEGTEFPPVVGALKIACCSHCEEI